MDQANKQRVKTAILGSGNIGTDLMMKITTLSQTLELAAMVGVDPMSDGLARASALGIVTTAKGIDGLVELPVFKDIEIVFDATSAGAHKKHDAILRAHGKRIIDLTPAAIGPYVVPSVNMNAHMQAPNINMVTCGGQATIPIVAAIGSVASVRYGEIVASIASKSAGPIRPNPHSSCAIRFIACARRPTPKLWQPLSRPKSQRCKPMCQDTA